MHDSPTKTLRLEIATRAARLIAEEGLDYGGAKRRAARELVGDGRHSVRGNFLPDNAQIESEVRAYQALFMADTQPARLRTLRMAAVDAMRWLADFRPYLVGAVLNGTAGEHSDIHLQLYCDSAKEVEIFLINAGIDFETSELAGHGRIANEPVETLSFVRRTPWARGQSPAAPEGVHLSIFRVQDLRMGSRTAAAERADLADLEGLLASPPSDPPDLSSAIP